MPGLLDMLARRGDYPAYERSQKEQEENVPPMRGKMSWDSGFEGFNRDVLAELLRALQARQAQQQAMAKRNVPFPYARVNRGS